MKKLEKTTLLLAILSVMTLLATIAIYSKLPQTIATHFDINGNPDSYGNRSTIFITAILPLASLFFMTILPKIDPRAENYQKFKTPYAIIKAVTVTVLIGVHGLIVLYTLKIIDNPSGALAFYIALLFIVMGNYLPKVKHNYFVGVKTPWTLASETSWRTTNRLAGYMFSAVGVLILISLFINQRVAFYIMIGGAIGTGVIATVISYIVFNNEKKKALK